MKITPEILLLACQVPLPLARAYFLGAKDGTATYIGDEDAIALLARFWGLGSPDNLSGLDYLSGVDHLQNVLGQ